MSILTKKLTVMDKEIENTTLNINQLAGITDLHRQTIAARLKDVPLAKGSNAKLKRYAISDLLKYFLNLEPPAESEDPAKMKPADRLNFYRAENERLKFEQDTAQVIPADEVVKEYAQLIKALIQVLETLPDILERDCGLSAVTVGRVQESIDDIRDRMAEKVIECDSILEKTPPEEAEGG